MRFSLGRKMVAMLIIFAVFLIGTAVIISDYVIESMSGRQYEAKANELAATVAEVVDTASVINLKNELEPVYEASENKVNSDDWGSPEFIAYLSQFSYIEQTEDFKKLHSQLKTVQEANSVECVYLVLIDPVEKCYVYLVDADTDAEKVCPPGCMDTIYDVNHPVFTDPEFGLPAFTSVTDAYGWIVSSAAPVMDPDGRVICYAGVDISMDYIKAEQNSFIFLLTLLLLIITACMCLLAILFVNRSLVHPIDKLSKAALEYGSQEKSENSVFQPIVVRTGDEIEILHNSMIQMEKDIDTYVDDLIKTGVELRSALDEADKLKKLYRDQSYKLSDALSAAEKANKAKTDFLSNMSHEIRTPINAILGMDEMIVRESKDRTIMKYALDIKLSGQTLLGLVNDLLDFSRIESGKLELIPEEYDVGSLLNEIVNMISIRAGEKGLDFITDIDANMPRRLYGDPVRIEQCALNLLTNAVKYTHRGSVTMKVYFSGGEGGAGRLHIEIQDTGIGIKSEDMEKLTSPFERIEESRSRTIEGTGLGLSIVKNLLSMMGTRLEAESVYGQGSVFSFAVEQEIVDRSPLGNFEEVREKLEGDTQEYHESFQAPDARILIVDDLRMNLNVAAGLLKKVRLQIDTAVSGYEALEKVKTEKYDCIFLDHRMPGMDGVETLHEMKNAGENASRGAPCVALTANAVSGAKEMFLKEGFDDYLSKPIEGKALEKMLMKYLPAEKVFVPGDKGYSEEAGDHIGEISSPFMRGFSKIKQINAEQALKFCVNEDLLRDTVSDYADAAAEMTNLIEKYAAEGDIKNYTIKVHALKSSSRMIGAAELSELAAELEACGDSGDESAINAKTPLLLEMYRNLRSELEKLLNRKSPGPGSSAAKDDRPEISADELNEIYAGLRELIEAFDFESAEDIVGATDGFRLPPGEAERFEQLKRHIKALERDKLLELLA